MLEVYEFDTGAEILRFSPSVKEKSTLAGTFTPASIRRSSITLDENPLKASITFNFPETNAFAINCLKNALADTISVKIYENDITIWSGRVVSVKLKNGIIDITCELSNSVGVTGLGGARFSRYCWKVLYSANCGVNKESFSTVYQSYTIQGREILVTSNAVDNYYLGGIAQIGNTQRHITSSTATSVMLSDTFPDSVSGDLTLIKGCSLTRAACLGFNNLENFGGFSYVATKKIYSGQSLLN